MALIGILDMQNLSHFEPSTSLTPVGQEANTCPHKLPVACSGDHEDGIICSVANTLSGNSGGQICCTRYMTHLGDFLIWISWLYSN
jgi:hypothetical protein